jgi:signal transduction histidine kinase
MTDQLKMASIPLTLKINENVSGHWDPDRLEQVLENLITNAIRYARNSPLYVSLSIEEKFAVLEVCDQGPGIPEEDHEKIFNRFEQLRSFGERSGMGLGLYIVKEIVSLHGGKISVSNLNKGGTRFVIELPILHEG